ncbi:ribosome maturation factor rimP [Trifolium pratense]|uniref:Ribosome maturation factor rimP n=1 Tax=Trifolium pratense TaxID=57577 RepID=A0A2K3P5C3_TRIPR|nr:ribosome maturation factor rimP [Trifolium pratense]
MNECFHAWSAVKALMSLGFSRGDGNENGKEENETSDKGESTDGWEEEDEAEPKIGDGGSGGGVALQNVPWGQRALSIAEEVLVQFSEDLKLYAFKTSPGGYVYVRLDKVTSE